MCHFSTNVVLLVALATPIAAGAADLEVTVTDVRNASGDVRVAVVDADGWNRKHLPCRRLRCPRGAASPALP